MCGIVGYIGKEEAYTIILNSLKKLEYRGYDSWGIATISESYKLLLIRAISPLGDCKESLIGFGNIGIGHVRWATHGKVTIENAHPHTDCSDVIAVVHNGIIENYQELKLKLAGHKFSSETDTEVIPHLIEKYMNSGVSLRTAVTMTANDLRGSYAFLVLYSGEPGTIIAVRKNISLVVGIGDDFNMIASDSISLVDKTNKIIFPEDNDIIEVTADSVTIYDINERIVERETKEMDWKTEDTEKGDYPHFMLKEIMEQPITLAHSIEKDRELITDVATAILDAKQFIITACGTSRYAALVGRYLFSKIGGKLSEVIIASELPYFSDSITKDTLIIAVSQSGETADITHNIKQLMPTSATLISIVNVPGSSLDRMSDKVIYLGCGPEVSVAATKTFTAELVVFYLIAFAMSNRLDEGIKLLRTLPILIEDSLCDNEYRLRGLAKRISTENDCYYIARGINFAIAGESALKLKEISYIHAEGMPAGELKHGTLSLITRDTPVIGICPTDNTYTDTLSNLAEAKSRGAYIIGVSNIHNPLFDMWIRIPTVSEIFYPLVSVVPTQLLAYYTAIEKGLNPDRPRNLAKSVTVK